MVEALQEKTTNQEKIKTPEREIPTLSEDFFFNKVQTTSAKARQLNLVDYSWIAAFCGPKGAGKSMLMSYFAAFAMAVNKLKCYANYDISFNIKFHDGHTEKYRSEPLKMESLVTFDSEIENCIIVLDEAPIWINSKSSMSWRNRLIDLILMQVRKRSVSWFWSAQNPQWADNQFRWSTDIAFMCHDAHFRYPKIPKGEKILVDVQDISGQLTGYSYEEKPLSFGWKFEARPYWNIYDTSQIFDAIEGMRKVENNLETLVIADQPKEEIEYDFSKLKPTIKQLFERSERWSVSDLCYRLKVASNEAKKALTLFLFDMGITKRSIAGQVWYVASEETYMN